MDLNTISDKDQIRFWKKVNKNSGIFGEDGQYQNECWIWTAGKTKAGYGNFRLQDKHYVAHNITYFIYFGNVKTDLELDHLCRRRDCVNPFHLEVVTHKINILRGKSPPAYCAKKTHCLRGHEFSKENTYISSKNKRSCRLCSILRDRKRHGYQGRAKKRKYGV